MLDIGIRGEAEVLVTEENTAGNLGSGDLKVFATPAMIALIEKAAYTSVLPELEEGQGTVGTVVNVQHLAATPIGMKVKATSELTAIEGRTLTFHVEAYDEAGRIGEGTHQRVIIWNEKFQAKADAKL